MDIYNILSVSSGVLSELYLFLESLSLHGETRPFVDIIPYLEGGTILVSLAQPIVVDLVPYLALKCLVSW